MRAHADQRTTRRDENLALNLAVCAEHIMMMDTHADGERGKEKGVCGDENGEGFDEGEEEATTPQQGAARNRANQDESGVGLQADREALLNIQRNPEVHVRASKTYHLPCPVGVDIGGSLAKMAYFRPPNPPAMPSYVNVEKHYYNAGSDLPVKPDMSLEIDLSHGSLGGVLKFLKFPSANVVEFVDFILCHNLHAGYGGTDKIREINCTGGGAYKFREIVKSKLGIQLVPCDEMRSMIRGLNFLLRNTKNEIFCFTNRTKKEFIGCNESEIFPYLMVSCGSGVSILLVKGDDDYERVSGSAIGGATFYGLCRMLTGLETFEDIQLSGFSGNHENIDLLVGDIYGGDLPQFGLSANTVASHFGKAAVQFPRASNNSGRVQIPDYIEESQLYSSSVPKSFTLRHQRKRSSSSTGPFTANSPSPGRAASNSSSSSSSSTPAARQTPKNARNAPAPHVCVSSACPCPGAQGRKSSSFSSLPAMSASQPPPAPVKSSSSGSFPLSPPRKPTTRRKSTTNAGSSSPPIPRSHSLDDLNLEAPWESPDIVQALMYMVCSNIAQLAYLNAKHYNITRVFFSGGFVRNNPLLWNKLSTSIDYWSKGNMRAHFLLHDGYLGALGALLSGASATSSPPPSPTSPHTAETTQSTPSSSSS